MVPEIDPHAHFYFRNAIEEREPKPYARALLASLLKEGEVYFSVPVG